MTELYDYFKKSLKKGIIDHKIRASFGSESELGGGDHRIFFYIHPDGKDGDTPRFILDGNGKLLVEDESTRQTPNCPECGKIMFQEIEERGTFFCMYHVNETRKLNK